MGGGRIDDFGLVAVQAVDHGHRVARGIVMQAQDDHVDLGHQGALGFRVFAQGRVNADQLDVGHQGQAFANLQPGGAGFAVNENFGHRGSITHLGSEKEVLRGRKPNLRLAQTSMIHL